MKTMDASGTVSAPSKVRQPVTMCAAGTHRCTVCRPSKPTGSPHCQYLHSLRVESHATAWSRRVGTRAEGGDLSESVDWVRRAAEGGLGLAMSRLATVLRNGQNVPRDDVAASLWYRQVSKGPVDGGAWEDGGLGSGPFGRRADMHVWPAPWRARATLSLSLSPWAPPLRLPPLWQAINASNEPTAHCHFGQMLWEGTAFPSTPHRTALEEVTAHFNTK